MKGYKNISIEDVKLGDEYRHILDDINTWETVEEYHERHFKRDTKYFRQNCFFRRKINKLKIG